METSLDIFRYVRNMNSKAIKLTIATCRIGYSFTFRTICDISALILAVFLPYSWPEERLRTCFLDCDGREESNYFPLTAN